MSDVKDTAHIITIRNYSALRTLELWLEARDYNDVFPFLEDRKGARMIGLNWKNPNGTYEKRGLVVLPDIDILSDAIEVCEKGRKV